MKKALIITYYWPPAGGPGVQRWLKFVKYLRDFQVEPIVYVPENPNYPITDNSLEKEIPEKLTVLKQPISEPYRMAELVSKKDSKTISKGIIPSEGKLTFRQRILLFIRGNFFIPDARKRWVKPSVTFLSEFIIDNDINLIITTGPPHSLHLIGLSLKSTLGIKWIADFRDPWTSIGYHRKLKLLPFAQKKHEKMEKEVLDAADHVLVTSYSTRKAFRKITDSPVHLLTNGYDDEEVGEVQRDKKFSISHIGSLLTDRNPEILWEVLRELTIEDNTFKSLLQINLIGHVGTEVIETLEDYDLNQFVNLKGYLNHNEAVREQRRSQVLLLLEIDSEETRAIIPGKVFEYIKARRPILAIGPDYWDAGRLINETNSGISLTHDDKEGIKEVIIDYFKAFRKNQLEVESQHIKQYSRKQLTGRLAELILN